MGIAHAGSSAQRPLRAARPHSKGAPYPTCLSCPLRSACGQYCADHGLSRPESMAFFRGQSVERNSVGGVLVIRSGFAIDFFPLPDGRKNPVAMIFRGSAVGESGELLTVPAADYLYMATDVEACFLPSLAYASLIRSCQSLAYDLATASQVTLEGMTGLIWILQGMSVRDRVERFLVIYYLRYAASTGGTFVVPISHEAIAMLANSERASVSRALKAMENEGLLLIRPNALTLLTEQWLSSPSVLACLEHADSCLLGSSLELESLP